MRRFPLGQLACLTALVVLGGLTFTRVFEAQDIAGLVLGAACLPALLALALRSRPKPNLLLVTGLDAALFVFFCGITIFADTVAARLVPTGATFGAIVDGIRDGWAEILSSTVPAPALATSLFVPVAATWLTAVVSAELLFRTRRRFLVLLPAVLLAGLGTLFADDVSGTWGWGAVAFVGLAATTIATRSSSFTADPRSFDDREVALARDHADEEDDPGLEGALLRHRLSMAVPFIAVVLVVAIPVSMALPIARADDPVSFRDHFEIPITDRHEVSPLAQVPGAQGNDAVRFQVAVDTDLPADTRLQTAILDQFAGATWSSSGEYVTTGSALPVPPALDTEVRTVVQEITVVDASQPWLPALGQPVEIDAPPDAGVQVDPVTSALLVPSGPTPGLTYTVTSAVASVTPEQLQLAGVGVTQSSRQSIEPIELPPGLAAVQAELQSRATSPFQQLAWLLGFFRNNETANPDKEFTENADAEPGFTLAAIERFVAPDVDGSRSGRPEQFAAAFATLARAQGFPTRIVVGYRLPDSLTPGVPVEIREQDLTAWPEVALDGLGWVALDPVPTAAETEELTVEEQQLEAAVDSAVSQSTDASEVPPGENPLLQNADVPEEPASRAPQIIVMLVLVAATLLSITVTPWLRKRSRRRRRRGSPDPASRAAGAWQEAMDRLTESGVDSPQTLTTIEAARLAGERYGPDTAGTLRSMGSLVNRALHDRVPPDAAVADEAWRLSDEFTSEVRAHQSVRQRIRSSLDRRPLRRSPDVTSGRR